MRKATQKVSLVTLGAKRSCLSCGTKFYDFGKAEVACPKCDTKLNLDDLGAERHGGPALKKAPKKEKTSPDESILETDAVLEDDDSDNTFESLEELDDEEDDVLEDLTKEDGGEEKY